MNDTNEPVPAHPTPRRRARWGRRILLALTALVVVAVVSHAVWGWRMSAGLARQMDAYRRARDPVAPADLNPPPVPDSLNAATDLRAAASLIDTATDDWEAFHELQPAVPLTEREVAVFRRIVDASAAALPRVEAATGKPGMDWGTAYQSPMINTQLRHLKGQRDLAALLWTAALLAHHDGRHDRAVRYIRELLFVSRAVDHEATLISHLVALGVGARACDALAQIAPDLNVGPGDGAVPREAAEALVRELLDERPLHDGLRRALIGERIMQVDAVQATLDGKISLNNRPGSKPHQAGYRVIAFVAKPLFLNDARLMAAHTTAVMENAGRISNGPDFDRSVIDRPPEFGDPVLHTMGSILMPNLKRAVGRHYSLLTERRMAAAVLAARLYALDHGGKLPGSFQDLVPRYLPAVPADAMAPGAPPLVLVTSEGRPPVVYSAGENGKDDGGHESSPTASRAEVRRTSDDVRHLTRRPRPAPPPEEEAEAETPNESDQPAGEPAGDDAPVPESGGAAPPAEQSPGGGKAAQP